MAWPTPTRRWAPAACTCSRAERLAAALERRDMPAGGVIVVVAAADAPAVRSGAAALGLVEGIWDNGTVTAGDGAAMSATELVALVCCDLGAIVRGRSLPASELGARLDAGVGWVPANQSLTPLGPLAEPNPFGSTGDLRLLPDPDTRVRVEAGRRRRARWSSCSATSSRPTARRGSAARGSFLRDALAELERRAGHRVVASFEHEFQLLADAPRERRPFSLEAQRRAEPFAARRDGRARARRACSPNASSPSSRAHQFEIPVQPAEGLAAADRSVVFREVVREVARRHGCARASRRCCDPAEAGNGVHIHLSLLDAAGRPRCTTRRARRA